MSFVVKAVKGVVKAVGNIVKGVIKAVGNIVSAVVDFVLSPFMGIFGVPDMPSDAAEAERQQGVLVQRQGSNVNIPVVYGFRKIGGIVTFAETGEENNKYLWVAYTLCEGPVEGLYELFIDDHQLDSDVVRNLNAGSTVNISSGKYKDRVKLQFINQGYYYRNLQNHPMRRNNICINAPSWDDNMIYNGVAVLLARYEWKEIKTQEDADNNPFTGNIPVLQASVLGRRVATLMNNTSEFVTYNGSGYSERYSTNPAEILLDYLRNPRYGKGLANNEINWTSFRVAAAKCNQEVQYYSNQSYRGPILTTNYVLDTGATLFNNTKTLLTNMRGYLPYVEGRYKLKIEDAGNPTDILSGSATVVKTVTRDNLVGNITYTGIDRGSKYTRVKVKYVNPEDKWTVQEMYYPYGDDSSVAQEQAWIEADGGRKNEAEITFPGVTNPAIAFMMARTICLKSRYQDSLSFKMDSTGFDLEVGDIIHVNANILKFSGTDKITDTDIPWRVVSIKANNDMTFDIGAVRNPDFIYPHVNANEPDIVIPPYIPRGAEIYYPGNPRPIPIGIIPPTRSPHPGIKPEPTPPPDFGDDDPDIVIPGEDPTDPGGDDGGGVGDGDGDINEGGENDNPPDPPIVYTFDDAIDFTNVAYSTTPGTNAVSATFTFEQPAHPQYAGIDVYWKLNSNEFTSYRHMQFDSKQAAGAELSFTIENLLPERDYQVIARVYYSTGDTSEVRTSSYINPIPGESTDVEEVEEVNQDGINLPIAVLTNKRNNYLKAIVGQTLLTGGLPRDPREMQVTVTQSLEEEVNDVIYGINIYYKPTANTYYYKSTYVLPNNYVQGEPHTFTLPDTLGASGTADQYDFVFRILYVDNTESKYQGRYDVCDVETPDGGITYDYDPFEGKQLAKGGKELVGTFPVLITDEEPIDPPVDDPRDFIIVPRDMTQFPIKDLYGKQLFHFFPNTQFDDSDGVYQGIRVRYRSLDPDDDNTIVTLDFLPVTKNEWGYEEIQFPVVYNKAYEYVISPVVRYQGNIVDCKQSWLGRGIISTSDGSQVNHWQKLGFRLEDTQVAIQALSNTRTLITANPTVQVLNGVLRQLDSVGLDQRKVHYTFKINYSQITGYEGLRIYRRSRSTTFFDDRFSEAAGYGTWEIIEDTTTNVDEEFLLNLRRGLHWSEYDIVSGDVRTFFSTLKPIRSTDAYDEFIFVVKANGSYSNIGTYMRGSPLAVHPFRGYVLFEKSLFDIAIPQEINYASLYNGFSTDTDRNLNNAVTVKAVSDCYNQDGNPRTGWSYPTPSGTTMK
jgi:hypothetical protein